MKYDPLYYPYPSRRTIVYGRRGMVCSSHPLAAQAGLEILKKGGNAVDAAVATAITLTVVEPTSNGIGGDAFALFWQGNKLHGLNSSGPAPASISMDTVKARGYTSMPTFGWVPVTVPGAPAAWSELSEKFGCLEFEELFQPAIEQAKNGHLVYPTVGKYWKYAYERYKELEGEEFKTWFDIFAPNGRAPAIGEMWRSDRHAETLTQIAKSKGRSFYSGELAEKIDEFSQDHGGYLSLKDLKEFSPEWVEPLSVNYRGYDVWELPPNGQGIITLMALNILKGLQFSNKDSVDTYHKQIDALKLAFSDGKEYITDPNYMDIRSEKLVSEEYAKEKRSLIQNKAIEPDKGARGGGGTVYLATADEEGNMVSYIQSNYMGFGSGLVVPETGIALHNRGNTFSLDPSHINCLEPRKRTYHTIIPGFITLEDEPIGPFGVMGGYMQPQGHLQVVMNLLDFGLNPQACLDAPRWRWERGKHVVLEDSFPKHIGRALGRRGHEITYALHAGGFGRGQIILKNREGYGGATEPRTDGHIGVW